MSEQKKYWNSIQQLEGDKSFVETSEKEFAEYIPVDEFLSNHNLDKATTSRRDFLKFLGFSVSAATLAACETPVVRSIPYVNKPEEITPGVANYYASTYYDGHDYCSILVKTREGRPIFIEGNKISGVTKGGINARVNSSILSLYDTKRIKQPLKNNEPSTWEVVDSEISDKIKNAAASGKKVRLVTNTIISPSSKMLIDEFISKVNSYSNVVGSSPAKHVSYDTISYSGMLNANEKMFGKSFIPGYRFDKAKVICSIGADFLSTWLNSIEYSKQYASVRNPKGSWMTKHYQIESGYSLTGTNADVRIPVKPSEQGKVAVMLYNELAKLTGSSSLNSVTLSSDAELVGSKVKTLAQDLLNHKGESLVVCGSNDQNTQMVVNAINNLLSNYGSTVDTNYVSYTKSAKDQDITTLINEIKSGEVEVLLMYNVDPVYSLPSNLQFSALLDKVNVKVSFSDKHNYTTQLCNYVCPDHHYLESWNDANPTNGTYSITQPVISPLFSTRQFQDSLIKWAGLSGTFYDYMKSTWEKYGFPRQNKYSNFREYWNKSLHDGISEMEVPPSSLAINLADLSNASSQISSTQEGTWELELYTKTSILDGAQADNPWLQELPDPVSKVVWDNYITMNPSDMKEMGFSVKIGQEEPADMAKVVTSDGLSIELPVYPIPGQKRKTFGIALGYGKAKVPNQATKEIETIGKNAFPFLTVSKNGDVLYYNTQVSIEKIEGKYALASTQTHHTMMGRKIVLETTIDTFKKGKDAYNPQIKLSDAYGEKKIPTEINLWADHPIETFGHRWGMSIDLSTCIGCSACVTACTIENNVPIVGRDEVRRNRDMFWLRIDRYFSSDMSKEVAKDENVGKIEMYRKMEDPSEYPSVVHQPVMCQHCNHAPCETVCPVAATTHSNEGLNQMAYNRCIGTRYCANNCPYKVRRFNWFQYDSYHKFTGINPAQDDISRMVLNPDVVVRSRGVMEKCTMCVQKIQAGKLEAKKRGEKVQDGSIVTACASACPTNAITFGDINDNTSAVNKSFEDERSYFLLEEVGTQPNVKYLAKVRNIQSQEA